MKVRPTAKTQLAAVQSAKAKRASSGAERRQRREDKVRWGPERRTGHAHERPTHKRNEMESTKGWNVTGRKRRKMDRRPVNSIHMDDRAWAAASAESNIGTRRHREN